MVMKIYVTSEEDEARYAKLGKVINALKVGVVGHLWMDYGIPLSEFSEPVVFDGNKLVYGRRARELLEKML